MVYVNVNVFGSGTVNLPQSSEFALGSEVAVKATSGNLQQFDLYANGAFVTSYFSDFTLLLSEDIVYSVNATFLGEVIPPPVEPPTTPIPAPTANLMDFNNPVGWDFAQYGGAGTQIMHEELDPLLKHNGQRTIRIDPWVSDSLNEWREQNGPWIPITPGDKVTMRCWVKSGPATQPPVYTPCYPIGIGFDIYTELGSSHEVSTPTDEQWVNPNYSAMGDSNGRVGWSRDWTLISWSITIPLKITGQGADYNPGVECTPQALLFGFSGSAARWGNGTCWFSGMEVYINGGIVSTQTKLSLSINPKSGTVPFVVSGSAILETSTPGQRIANMALRFTKDGLPYAYVTTDNQGVAVMPDYTMTTAGQIAFGCEFDGDQIPNYDFLNSRAEYVYVVGSAVAIPPPAIPSGAASVGGVEIGGYAKVLPPGLVRLLWKFRNKYISREVHRKLHPLV